MSRWLKDLSFLTTTPVVFVYPGKYLICSWHYIFPSEITFFHVNYIRPGPTVPITLGGAARQALPTQTFLPGSVGLVR